MVDQTIHQSMPSPVDNRTSRRASLLRAAVEYLYDRRYIDVIIGIHNYIQADPNDNNDINIFQFDR